MTDIDSLWVRMIGMTPENRQAVQAMTGADISTVPDMESDGNWLYLPLQVMVRSPEGIARRSSLFIMMGDRQLITLQDQENFPPFAAALRYIRRHPEALDNPRTLLCLVLQVLNEQAGRVIASIGTALEETSDAITAITGSLNTKREVGVGDISDTMVDLNTREELISRCLESQLSLARAARYLDIEIAESETDLQAQVRNLRADINGVKEHAAFEHDKVRYLQNAVLASLNIKQNQIVKIFTIITAVFLPPTLIASLYGMNFAVMPEFSWRHGFPAVILLTLLTSLLPLVYIRYRGWLR
ncbi:MAG: magnesium transporter CorA [Pseudomonadota bacterium]|nr:magnesium transporter CorA [Pseudomonadota bacterium]